MTYPRWRYHALYEATLVTSDEHAELLGEGWADNPSAFGRDVANAPDAIRFVDRDKEAQAPLSAPKEPRKYRKREAQA